MVALSGVEPLANPAPPDDFKRKSAMRLYSRLAVSLLVAALATLAVASAEGAKPPSPPGKGPKLTFNPQSATFGPVAPNVGASQEFVLGFKDGTTSGGLGVSVSGDGFVITADTCTGTAINPSHTCTVTVTYTPSGYSESSEGTLTATGKKDVRPASALLSGSSTAALVSATGELNFGEEQVGESKPPLFIDFTNNATETLSLAGMDAPDGFMATSSSWMTCDELAPGASCFGAVVFNPASPGYYEGSFTTTWVNSEGVVVATTETNLTGTGTAAGNRAPVGEDFPVSVRRDIATTITLNGYDADGDELTFALVDASGPTHGTLVGGITNTSCEAGECSAQIVYVPAEAYLGGDSFSYTLNDGELDSATITVSITVVNPPNVTPQVPYGLSFYTNVSTTFVLTGTDGNIGDQLTFQIVEQPTHGTFGTVGTASCSGTPWTCTATVTYTPTAGYVGPDRFRFKANDGSVDSNMAYAYITVNPAVVGDEPWADPKDSTYNMDNTTTLTLTGGDPNGDTLTFEIVSNFSNGVLGTPASVTCSATTPSICSATVTYTPPLGFFGADSFTYRTFDGVNHSVPQIFTLHAS